MRGFPPKVPRIEIETVDDIADVAPRATHLLIDVDGTLLPFRGRDRGRETLLGGLVRIIDRQHPHVIVVTSNAAPQWLLTESGLGARVTMVARARKPWTSWERLDFPCTHEATACTRGVVGDQIWTDGLLALRLGVPFLQITHREPDEPLWPRFMRWTGGFAGKVIFTGGAA